LGSEDSYKIDFSVKTEYSQIEVSKNKNNTVGQEMRKFIFFLP